MEQFLDIHLFCVVLLAVLELFYLLFTQLRGDLHKYILRIRLLLPAYYVAYSFVFFTGLLLAANTKFQSNGVIMQLALFINFALSIYQFILFKKARRMRKFCAFYRASLLLEALKITFFLIAAAS